MSEGANRSDRSALDPDPYVRLQDPDQWETVTVEQRGPDGTTPIFLLTFAVCPICAAIISSATAEDPLRFLGIHADYHLSERESREH